MASSKKTPELIRTSLALHSSEEIIAIKGLYAETNPNSKTAFLNLDKLSLEQENDLSSLTILVSDLKKLIARIYYPKTTATITISPEREQDLRVLAKLIAKFNDPDENKEELIFTELLTLSDTVLNQLIPLAKHITKLSRKNQYILLNSPRVREMQLDVLKKLLKIKEAAKKEEVLTQLHEERAKLLLDIKTLAANRNRLPTLLAYHKAELMKANPASFRFLTETQKWRLKNQLLFTYFLLYGAYQLDAAEGRNSTLAEHQASLDLCSKRIEELDLHPDRGEKIDFQKDLEIEIGLFTKALKYLGLTILAEWLVEKIFQFMERKTIINDWISEINNKRLYWVWGGGMLGAALALLPATFFSAAQASQNLNLISPVTGYMSWVLYYCRLGINLLLLFKHTIKGPWMSEEESKIPAWERFKTQWDQRKFAILNDLFWAPINMACFFWLYGPGKLGYVANIATVILLTMDLALSIKRHWEESAKHQAAMEAIRQDRAALDDNIGLLLSYDQTLMDPGQIEDWHDRLADLKEQKKRLDKIEAKTKFDWKYKELGLLNDCVYAFILILSFCVFACFFFPPAALAPLTVMIIGLCGATACFLATTIYSAINGHIERSKSRAQSRLAKKESGELLEAFKKEGEEHIKKQLYLEMKGLMAESEYQERVAKYQLAKTIVSVLIDALFPAVVFATLVFMPVSVGILPILGIIAAVMVVSWFFNHMVMKNFEPKPNALPEFDLSEYEEFTREIEEYPDRSIEGLTDFFKSDNQEGRTSQMRFFNSAAAEDSDEDWSYELDL